MAKKRGLGRGLDALLNTSMAESKTSTEPESVAGANTASDGDLQEIPIDKIQRGKYQPRRDMKSESLEELAASIKAQGVMQPIVVRHISADKFEIIAGERRWRATQIAGLDQIPAIIKDVPDEAAIAMSLIENIQRENLNPIEEAFALQRLQDEFELTHQQVADAVGKSRATVTNLLRLMGLNEDVKTMVEHGDLEMGHARALLGLNPEAQSAAARDVVSKSLSVRQTEAMVRSYSQDKSDKKGVSSQIDPDIKQLQDDLSDKLCAPVMIQHTAKGKGKLVIKYNSLDELDGVLAHIK